MKTPREEDRAAQRRVILFFNDVSADARARAVDTLRQLGVRVLQRHGDSAVVVLTDDDRLRELRRSGLFSGVYASAINEESFEKFPPQQRRIAEMWNYRFSDAYREAEKDRSEIGKSWGAEGRTPPDPPSPFDPAAFRGELLRFYDLDSEDELLAQFDREQYDRIDPDEFAKRLDIRYDNEQLRHHLELLADRLGPRWYPVLIDLPEGFIYRFFWPIIILPPAEPGCWKMEGEIAVGVVFVESAREGGPVFSASDRVTLQARLVDGRDWLAVQAPTAAHLTWVYDWQYVEIDVANDTDPDSEDYWRDPAMGEVTFNGNTYSQNWSGVVAYREDLRTYNYSQHAIAAFVTPFGNTWHAYAGGGRLTLANKGNWGGWGINTVDEITSHEVCHLFGATDEYTGSGTPCSSCGGTHGCYNIPNGNCGACADPRQDCIMDANQRRLCAYTQAHIGWADLFVELTTADVLWAGTDDTVWFDSGERTFVLDNLGFDDRERGHTEGYALNYTGMTVPDIKRVGIRKSPDGFAGGWKLQRVRVWCQGTLVCDANNINQWLEDEYRWWASTSCGSSAAGYVNRLRVRVRTADVWWAGTDDDVTLTMGGRSWNLDNPWHNDFERGNTDTFDLDPGTGLTLAMLSSIRIHKSPDGLAGGWKLGGLEIIVNGSTVFDQSINQWLEDDHRDWFGTI